MPFKSEAQRKFMYAQHPDIAKKWSAEEKKKKGSYSREAVEMARKLRGMNE